MKKYILLLSLSASFILFLSFNKTDPTFIGRWEAINEEDTAYMVFDKEGYATLHIGDGIIGGKHFVMDGYAAHMIYSINESKTPKEIDFIIKKNSNDSIVSRTLGIYQFVGGANDKIKMNINLYGNTRPTAFEGKGFVTFTRK